MKTKTIMMIGVLSLVAGTVMSRPTVTVVVPAPSPPVVVAPAPAVTVAVGIPDTYVWDGYEYVGVVGNQYYYLGPGNVWLAMDPIRLGRFHTWETAHADWRTHATRNMLYRRDAAGHDHPWHSDHGHGY